jgi:DNA repair protein RecO (recombination protein O)
MIVTTKAIVLNAIKYRDNDLIVKCFTEEEGCKSYLLRGVLSSKKGKVRKSYFQPLSQIELTGNHNIKGKLNSIKDVQPLHHYFSIYSDVYKQAIVFFLAEILNVSLQEEEENRDLYTFLETSFLWLDTHDKTANFHILFMLNLSKFLGFYPDLCNMEFEYFDLVEGRFSKDSSQSKNMISGEVLKEFKMLLGINFDSVENVLLNSSRRHDILKVLIQYFELHLTGFRTPKSLEVLKTVFG